MESLKGRMYKILQYERGPIGKVVMNIARRNRRWCKMWIHDFGVI
jgi:hypothetical protein